MNIPLHLLLPLVVGGVALTVGLTHLLGGSTPAALSVEAITDLLALDLPDAVVDEVLLADDRRAALVTLRSGHAAVLVLGDRLVSRLLPAGLRAEATERGLRLRLPDPGCPRIDVALSDSARRQEWLDRLRRPA